MKIYLVWSGEYSDKEVVCVTTDREKAEKYAALMNNEYLAQMHGNWGYGLYDYRVQEQDTDDFPDISSTLDFADEHDIVYGWKFVSSYYASGENSTMLYRCYFNKDERNVVEEMELGQKIYIVNILADSKDLALKIGRDIIAKHRAIIEGIA